MTEMQNAPPDLGEGCMALGAAAIVVALPLSILMGGIEIYPVVAITILAIVLTIGLVVFALVRKRPTWPKVLAGGFFTGAIAPALVILPTFFGVEGLAIVGGFGAAGIVGALLVWALLG